nr:cytochrome P450 [Mycobacterium gallinarum]
MTAIMSRRFAIDVSPSHAVELEATLTLRPENGLHVIAQRREAL